MGAGRRPSFLQTYSLDARRKVRAGADRAAEFADGDDFAGAFKALERAAKFVVHQRQLQAERGRLGVDAVAAADARREFVFLGAPVAMDGQQLLHVGDEDVRALHHLDGEGGVNDVAAGQAEMEPAAGVVVDFFGDGGGEADDVVIERLFQFLLARDEAGQIGEPFVRAAFDFGEIGARHDAFLDQCLAGEQFDLQPEPELVFVGPDGPHFRSGIARNHAHEPKMSRAESRESSAGEKALVPRPSPLDYLSCTSRRMASYITAPIRAGRAASGLAKGTAPSRPRVISLVPAFSQFALNGSVYTL